MGLTSKQAVVLGVIKRSFAEHGHAPTFLEIERETGFAGRKGIQECLIALEERGHIRRLYGKARAIELLSDPTPSAPYPYPVPGIVRFDRSGAVRSFEKLEFIPRRNIGTLNLKQMERVR